MPDIAVSRSAFRFDGLADALAPLGGYGASPDPYEAARWDASGALAYAEGGLAAAIVDRPAGDAVARGWDCEGDPDGLMADEWSRLDAGPVFEDALRYALRDGAGAVLALCQDGPDLAEPLREGRVGEVIALRPLSGAQLSPNGWRYTDPSNPWYGEPTGYRVRPLDGGNDYEVHETRLLRVPGEPMARAAAGAGGVYGLRGAAEAAALPWAGRPRLGGRVGRDLRRYQDALRWLLTLLERKQQPVHQAAGLAEMLAAADAERRLALASGLAAPADDAYAVVRARARSVDMTRGTLGTVMVDGADKFSVLDLDLGGTGEVLREMKIALAASTRMPVSILFGESAKGLNATGENDWEGWYGHVAQVQNRCLRPGLERLTQLLWLQDAFRGKQPERWRVVFNALWTPDEATLATSARDRAQARKAEADALATLADLQIATPEELRAAARATVPEWGLSDGPPPDTAEPGDALDAEVERVGGTADGTPRLPARDVGVTPGALSGTTARATAAITATAGTDGIAPQP